MGAELRQKAKKKTTKESKMLFSEKISPASRILRKLSKENTFYFFKSNGNYTGESVASLEEFSEKIREIDIRSLEFHLSRRDFEKWIAETLEDRELATEIGHLQKSRAYRGRLTESTYRHGFETIREVAETKEVMN